METINNMASAAAKAVWGEENKTQEPVSGRTGDTTKGEPYDAGNLDETSGKTTGGHTGLPSNTSGTSNSAGAHNTTGTTGTTGITGKTTGDHTGLPSNTSGTSNSAGAHNTTGSTGTTGITGKTTGDHTGLPSDTSGTSNSAGAHNTTGTTGTTNESGLSKAEHEGLQEAKTTGTAKEPTSAPNNPSSNLKNTDAPSDTTKGQNDVRDPSDPQTHPKEAPTDVDNTGEGVNKSQKLDGPGPKPLEEVAKEHGGDAGTKETAGTKGNASGGAPGTDASDELNQPSKGEGTGEQYVKSSGLEADGGDFDATKPGAGREADRLLESKGIHKAPAPGKPDTADETKDHKTTHEANTSDDKDKVSLKDKIKAKLHKH